MAVVQISRIQIRRGKANSGSGMPQLASGEMAWAVDSQELYIGNGSVAEGAPGVGNTKILTQNDITGAGNFLNLLDYVYRPEVIQTGPTVNAPIVRSLQERLDDRVSLKEFGAVGDGVTDDTAALQRAIDELFLKTANPAYNSSNSASIQSRITLEVPPGKYKISSTITVPSYATIIGAGADKTIFYSTVAGTAMKLIHDGYPTVWNNSNLTQPRKVTLKGFSVLAQTSDQNILQLNSVTECRFENLFLQGLYSGTYNANSIGINMTAFSDSVTCYHNIFKDVQVAACSFSVFSLHDIYDNVFEDCRFYNARQGIVLGLGANASSVGQKYGPRMTVFTRTTFDSIRRHAVYVNLGSENTFNTIKVGDAGQNNGNITYTQYPQIYFKTVNNIANDIVSVRPGQLSTTNLTVPYVPELAGKGVNQLIAPKRISLANIVSASLAFRLPVATDDSGTPGGSIVYNIDYIYQSNNNGFTRRGRLSVAVNLGNSPTYNAQVQLTDEYDFAGTDTAEKSLKLVFSAAFLDQVGTTYIASLGQVPTSLAILYSNSLSGDNGFFTYTYQSVT